ncbi:heme ABC transporter substrate-binding protein IsdE [Viridibacillus sp. YIM B01967]|uniref:High-affinity heme uptake system protein IsdE n=1 Tax=Viridibacillus soli TaxID=2798301 RepID=A0ABS1HD24_9BACL|nr:heme ABC transporter substrate-binding protein IsdE [Viridibacillus soli]MBK3497356.1 heme ABC transporter substrate-binding protein IsdE [Viridibacillus soli]
MKRKRYYFFFISVLLLVLVGCSGGKTEKEPKKTEEKTTGEAKENYKLVAGTLAIAEIMDALEIDLIGIPTTTKDIPERYKDATEIGNAMMPDMEIVKSLNPDEIISVTTLEYDLSKAFSDIGIKAHYMNLQSIANMQKEILAMGKKYNREEQAEKLSAKYDEQIALMAEKVEDVEKPRVLVLLGVPGSYLVATEHSYIGNLVELAGGTNAIQGQDVEYLASNTEFLHESNPDIILRLAHGMPDDVVKMFDKEFKTNDIWKHFDAVKNDKVYDLEESVFGTTANLQVDAALDDLFNILHP